LDRSDGLMKLRIPSKHRRNQDQHQFNSMQYAEHERAPIPVACVRILSRNINSRCWLLGYWQWQCLLE